MQLFMDNGVKHMYRPLDKLQHSFLDFNQPMGLKMNPDNRWVKMADCIPWDEFEIKYAELFPSGTGNVAKPLRMALGALIIQTKFPIGNRQRILSVRYFHMLQKKICVWIWSVKPGRWRSINLKIILGAI